MPRTLWAVVLVLAPKLCFGFSRPALGGRAGLRPWRGWVWLGNPPLPHGLKAQQVGQKRAVGAFCQPRGTKPVVWICPCGRVTAGGLIQNSHLTY